MGGCRILTRAEWEAVCAGRTPLCEEDQKRHSSTPAGPAFANLQGKTFTRSENVQTKPGNFDMTDEAKALVERLRRKASIVLHKRGWSDIASHLDQAADLLETQAREIERLRGDLEVARKEAGSNYRVALAWERTARAALGESHD